MHGLNDKYLIIQSPFVVLIMCDLIRTGYSTMLDFQPFAKGVMAISLKENYLLNGIKPKNKYIHVMII